jgi:hypothetical protein
MDLTGESYKRRIEARVRTGGGKEGDWQGVGGGEALTRVNRPGARGGSGRPESEKKTSPSPSGDLGGAMGVGGGVLE